MMSDVISSHGILGECLGAAALMRHLCDVVQSGVCAGAAAGSGAAAWRRLPRYGAAEQADEPDSLPRMFFISWYHARRLSAALGG